MQLVAMAANLLGVKPWLSPTSSGCLCMMLDTISLLTDVFGFDDIVACIQDKFNSAFAF